MGEGRTEGARSLRAFSLREVRRLDQGSALRKGQLLFSSDFRPSEVPDRGSPITRRTKTETNRSEAFHVQGTMKEINTKQSIL